MIVIIGTVIECKSTAQLPAARHCEPILGNKLAFFVDLDASQLGISGEHFYTQQVAGDFHDLGDGDFSFSGWVAYEACVHVVSAHKKGCRIGFSNTVIQNDGEGAVLYRRSVTAKTGEQNEN